MFVLNIPGVGGQSSRCMWAQTWDRHDADAQIQTLIGCPRLLPLYRWNNEQEHQSVSILCLPDQIRAAPTGIGLQVPVQVSEKDMMKVSSYQAKCDR